MKVYYDVDEKYPSYDFTEDGSWSNKNIEVTKKFWKEFQKAESEFLTLEYKLIKKIEQK